MLLLPSVFNSRDCEKGILSVVRCKLLMNQFNVCHELFGTRLSGLSHHVSSAAGVAASLLGGT
jgi:hypothetical protein